jgi:CDP-glucose 4,6-dehydratase
MKSWLGRSVLVTGGNGFVGGWLVDALLKNKAKVVVLLRDVIPNSSLDLLGCGPKIVGVRGDVEDPDVLERTIADYGVTAVFHLAAQSQVGVAGRSPRSTFQTNVMGTVNVLEAARRYGGCQAIVIASSDKAYGYHKELPYKEDFALQGGFPYDASKSCADLVAQSYFRTFGLPIAIARCGNIFGPCDNNLNRIVPETIRSLCRKTPPVIRSDGRFIRDYIYISDAVEAYLAMGRALLEGRQGVAGEAFNFGTNQPVSVLALVELMIKISGFKTRPDIRNTAKAEIREQYLSSEKAAAVLDWRPKVGLEEGLRRAFRWYARYFKENG